MSIDATGGDRTPMSQRERDLLKVMHTVLADERSQAEAARLLRRSVRQVRRIQRRLEAEGDQAVVHRLRGQPSNHRHDPHLRQQVLRAYRRHYPDFGPTFASEKLAEQGLVVAPETLRRWLLAEGLWQPRRQRDPHRRRRPRRSCWGELVQMDASIHDWTEGRGEPMVLSVLIDDATNWIEAGFYEAETVTSYFDLFGRWLRQHGRPLALYTDRDSIFEAQSKGRPDALGQTQFGRALEELAIELILAHSPQAKGRVERFFELAQDRWVKELRLAGVATRAQANALVRQRLQPEYNRRFTVPARDRRDAHRAVGSGHNLASILSVQAQRVVANDYTIRFENRCYQLEPPVWPGERGGKVVIELRLDGTMALRFRGRYLKFHEVGAGMPVSASLEGKEEGVLEERVRSAGGERVVGESAAAGCSTEGSRPGPYRPAADHPWRRTFLLCPK
jgi:hypothetical protein